MSARSALAVAFLAQGWAPEPGGVETHTLDLARALHARGHRVRALCLDGRPGLEPFSVRADTTRSGGGEAATPQVRLDRVAYRYHDHRALADLIHHPRMERVVLDWLAREPVDVLHVHHLTGFGAGVLASARAHSGAAVVVSLHDYWLLCPRGQMLDVDGARVERPEAERCGRCLAVTWPHLMPSGSGERRGPAGEPLADDAGAAAARTRAALEALGHADALVVPSPEAGGVFARAGVGAERLRVVEYGLDAEGLRGAVERARAELRGAAGVSGSRVQGSRVLGLLGSVLPSKGPLVLARAVLAAGVPGLRLEVHGPEPAWHGSTDYLEELRGLAAASEGRVRLFGPYARVDLPRVLARLDAVAVPSRWEETYGLVAREARAAGLELLVADRGGLPAAAAGGAGRVLPADDAGAWAAALAELGRGRPAGAGRATGSDGLRTLGEMADELEALYLELARPGARR